MNTVTLHDGFVPRGCDVPPLLAVSVGAGAIWMHTYDAVSAHGGRCVQGARSNVAASATVPNAGSYVAESNFFEPDWQRSYWGANYARLLEDCQPQASSRKPRSRPASCI